MRSPPAGSKPCTCAATLRVKRMAAGCRSCGLAPKCSYRRSLRCLTNGGSIDVADSGEDTSIRPGSWNTAKARDGTSGDLREPIRVHAREAGAGRPATTKGPGQEANSKLPGAPRRDTNGRRNRVGGGSEPNKQPWIREWEVVAPS